MKKTISFLKKTTTITNILVLNIALLLASLVYELALDILTIKENTWLTPFQFFIILIILILSILLRKTEIMLMQEFEAKKEQLLKEKIEDISVKLAGEERLLKEYKEAIDKSTIVSKTDKNGIITYVNKRFCKVTGYKEDELLGQTHRLIRHPDTQREFFRDMWITILSKHTWSGKIKNIRKNGGDFFVDATIVPITDSDDEVTEFMAIMFDITKETILEQQLLKNTIKKQEEAYKDELLKTKESFLLVFTHELKTPLNAIINFSSFVKKKLEKEKIEDKERVLQLLDSVKQNGEDMLFSVTNMLDTAKLISKKMIFADSVFDLGELLKETKQKTLPVTGFKCEAEIEEGVMIRGDRLRIGQIISNIISNAVKYGNGEILTTLRSSNCEFELRIEDNGFGIKDTSGLFELFWSDGYDTTRASKGTGIGLYYAKMLCDEFGLKIALCKPNTLAGACFCITGKTEKGYKC